MGTGGAPCLTVEDVEAARLLLRRADATSRCDGLALIDEWDDRRPDVEAARAVLRAVTVAYPGVGVRRADPALRFGRLLCRWPRSVAVSEVEAAYLVSAERVRRLLLHVLALRRDPAGVASLCYLLGADGPVDLVPLPAGEMLAPALDVVSAPELVPALLHVAAFPGWTWHAVDLLRQLVVDERLDVSSVQRIVVGADPLVRELVGACDRGAGCSSRAVDASRAHRFRLRTIVALLGEIRSDPSAALLMLVLASADARVSAMGAAALVGAGRRVAPERFDLIAREPEARAELIDGLEANGGLEHLPVRWRNGRARAEADLVRWLAGGAELGRAPDDVESIDVVAVGEQPGDGVVHLFRFRFNAPHWSSARGWMIGAAGPYLEDGSHPADGECFASSVYAAEDDDALEAHLDAIFDELGMWTDPDEA